LVIFEDSHPPTFGHSLLPVQVLEALQNEDLGVPVLLAVDDYNCLFGGTEFMEVNVSLAPGNLLQ
jgi:hypothetical protein